MTHMATHVSEIYMMFLRIELLSKQLHPSHSLQDYKLFDYAGPFSQLSNAIEVSHLLSSSCTYRVAFPSKFLDKFRKML